MSAEVLGTAPPAEAEVAASAPSRATVLLDPSLVNRLLAVATAVFAVPVLVELQLLLAPASPNASAPSTEAIASMLLAASLLATGFGALLLRAGRAPALRTARMLATLLALEAAALAASLAL
jgi:hypothetical protein